VSYPISHRQGWPGGCSNGYAEKFLRYLEEFGELIMMYPVARLLDRH
jgi:hypothetical protein